MESSEFAVLDLEPVSTAGLRATETRTRETVLGKRNRISIGQPFVRRVGPPHRGELLRADDLERFVPHRHEFFELELSFTLLPDEGCRFRSADFLVEMGPTQGDLPLVLRLMPEHEATRTTVQVSHEQGATIAAKDPVLELLDLNVSESNVRREEREVLSVHLESFGAQTHEAGWRVRLTDSREIPLNARGLRLLCVRPAGSELTAEFRVVAEIDILSSFDRWVTWGFRWKKDPDVMARHTIP